MAVNTNSNPMRVVTGEGLAYYHEKVKLLIEEAKGVELTQTEYNALSEEEKMNGTTYFIKDAEEGSIAASSIVYKGQDLGTVLDMVNSNINSIKSTNGVIKSSNADYAETGMWSDKNPNNEDRIGYFVTVSKNEAGITMVKANSKSDVRGVTVSTPAFAAGASDDKYDSNGNLLPKYNYVAFVGFVKVYDNGKCTIGGRCMCDDNGCAIPSSNNMGYEVIDRINNNSILILIEPSGDMLVRIKDDVDSLELGLNNNTPVRLTQKEYDALPNTKLTDNKTYYITDGADGSSIDAVDIIYDNSISKLSSSNVQNAINELNANVIQIGKRNDKGLLEYYGNKPRCILVDNKNVVTSDYGFTYDILSDLLAKDNWQGIIKNNDYIRLTTLNGETFNLKFNINTYKGYGYPDANIVPAHIDLISEHLIPSSYGWQMRTDNTNNGTSSIHSPYLASTNLINKLNAYFEANIPDQLKSHIITKRILAPGRYSSSGNINDDNTWDWVDLGKIWIPYEAEISGNTVWATKTYQGGLRQYPCFQDGTQICKKLGETGGRYDWWTASAYSGNTTYFVIVYNIGIIGNYNASRTWLAVPLCIRFK